MQSRFNFQVTEADITKAKRSDSYQCVVAQVIARTLKSATRIDVDSQAIRFSLDDRRLVFLTPYAVQGYVIAFDAGEPIEPFSFQLRSPARVRQRKLTAAGKVVERARMRARDAARRARKRRSAGDAHHQPSVDLRSAGDADHQPPTDPREAAKAAYADARRELSDLPLTLTKESGLRRSPLRVFKRKTRSYGHRLLRINQPKQADAAATGRA